MLRKLSVKEVAARQAELAKMRSLLFHAEIKSRRLRKIKSKKFHKVERKYREKLEGKELEHLRELDPEAYKARMEKHVRDRARERLTLKHKNTSRWVKHMLDRAHGDDADEGTRKAITEQLKLGEALRRKMNDVEARSDGEDDSSEGDGDEGGISGELSRMEQQLERGPLAGVGDKERQAAERGVMGMAFMKRSMQRQKEEATALLKDLQVPTPSLPQILTHEHNIQAAW